MELTDKQVAHTQKAGTEAVELAAGERLRIQSWNEADGAVDILAEVTVPEGKAWVASLVVDIHETDA